MRIVWIALALVISAAAGVFGFIYWPRHMRIVPPSGMPEVLAEESAILSMYLDALGMAI